MTEYFGRVYELSITTPAGVTRTYGSDVVAPLQISFRVDQTPSTHRALAEISIYGLKRENRENIYEQFSSVVLKAGYRGEMATIFDGSIENVQISRDGPDPFVTLFCQTGVQQWNNVKVNKTYGKNTPYKEIIRDVAAAISEPVTFVGDFDGLPRALKGKTVKGDAKQVLSGLSNSLNTGFDWLLTSTGEMLIVREGADRGDNAQEFAYTPINGLIGTPEITERGVNIDVLLNPRVRPYDRYTVESETRAFSFSGVYYQQREFPRTTGESVNQVIKIVHEGDYYGDTWQTTIEGRRING